MSAAGRAERIDWLNFSTPAMRTFHMTWFSFFICFLAWFSIAPLMPIVRREMRFTEEQVGWCVIGSVAITIVARIGIGWLCDRLGPRRCYTALMLVGSLPLIGIAFADSFASFLAFRVLIGIIGASFVITQYHTSLMFGTRCIGTANATTAGWGNLGGGIAQIAMPVVFAFFAGTASLSASASWRVSMIAVGILCAMAGIAYYFMTYDTPQGDVWVRRARANSFRDTDGNFWQVCRDPRVWVLFVLYGACFGLELTIENVIVLYLLDYLDFFKQIDTAQALRTAGLLASLFGLMNLFARTLGGWISDRCHRGWGLPGRVKWLFLALFGEGIALLLFSQAASLAAVAALLVLLGLFVKMSNGATYAVVPFVHSKSIGAVAGIVGAGGNVGAVVAGFLLKAGGLDWRGAFFLLGAAVTVISFLSFAVTFAAPAESAAEAVYPVDVAPGASSLAAGRV